MDEIWTKQTDKIVFQDILWERPETKKQAGTLLIIGGNIYGFNSPALAYQYAANAGIGEVEIVLPQSVEAVVPKHMNGVTFAKATPSGSLGHEGLNLILNRSIANSGTLLAGDFGRNSETALMLQDLLKDSSAIFTITKDALENLYTSPEAIKDRKDTIIVASLSQLQKLAKAQVWAKPPVYTMGMAQLVDILAKQTELQPTTFVTMHGGQFVIANGGRVVTTPFKGKDDSTWQLEVATHVAVFAAQHPQQMLEGIAVGLGLFSGLQE